MKIENLFCFDNSNASNNAENAVFCDKFRAKDIASGDVVPFRNQYYLMDPENFHFEKIDAHNSKIDKQKIKKFLDDKKIDVSVNEFMTLWNFQVWIHMMYPERSKYKALRSETMQMLKNSMKNPTPLSQAFERKIVMCTETSALAQMYLQHCGIDSVLYFGNAFPDANTNIALGGDAHAWLCVTLNGKKYFYDPANPIVTGNMLLPAIMDYSRVPKEDRMDFEKIIHQSDVQGGGFAYLESQDVYNTGRRWLYGFEYGYGRRRTERAVKRLKNNDKNSVCFVSERDL